MAVPVLLMAKLSGWTALAAAVQGGWKSGALEPLGWTAAVVCVLAAAVLALTCNVVPRISGAVAVLAAIAAAGMLPEGCSETCLAAAATMLCSLLGGPVTHDLPAIGVSILFMVRGAFHLQDFGWANALHEGWMGIGAGWLLLGTRIWPGLTSHAIRVGLLYQLSLLVAGADTLTVYALQISLLAVARWPASQTSLPASSAGIHAAIARLPQQAVPPLAIWDGACGLCSRTKSLVERLDLDRLIGWVTSQSVEARALGIPSFALEERMHLLIGNQILAGFPALRRLLLLLPASYFGMAGLAGAAWLAGGQAPVLLWGVVLVLYSPLADRPGGMLYDWIARNRHRIGVSRQCLRP